MTAGTVMAVTDWAASVIERRTSRRGFVGRTALVGSAVAVTGSGFVLRPGTAYAAVCSCPPVSAANRRSCDCSSLCCGGYTEFCCHLYGNNVCPEGTLLAGWWKVDNSRFCGGAARYYLDCNTASPDCGCGSSGVCRDSGTTCQCRDCNSRRDGCTVFRYGNCNNDVECVGPIVCRVVSCTKPWELDPGCSTVARTDPATANHHRDCLTEPVPITNEARAWVSAVYADYLGRAPTAEEAEDLARQASVNVDRTALSVAFSQSEAYIASVLDQLYRDILGRPLDDRGRRYWVAQLQSGVTFTEVAAFIYGSDEYFQQSGSVEGFVSRLYRGILGREPEAAGLEHWVEVASVPERRATVGGRFYDSIESRRRRVRRLYQRFLGRGPEAAGLVHWADELRSGDDLALATFLSGSREYFLRAQNRFG